MKFHPIELSPYNGTFSLELFDQNGVLILKKTINNDVYTTEVYDYSNGLYVLRVWDENKTNDAILGSLNATLQATNPLPSHFSYTCYNHLI